MKVAVVVGTRPEAIKMAPVILTLRSTKDLETIVVSSGQHREMLRQTLDVFGITPDINLNVMTPNQTLAGLTATLLNELGSAFCSLAPDVVLVHGDTTTAMAAALAAFYQRIRIGHVEAGLRTGDLLRPFPEEVNRRYIDQVADFLWTPTSTSKDCLLKEGLGVGKTILTTGNTVIDALLWAKDKISGDAGLAGRLRENFSYLNFDQGFILVTGHRRESFGGGFEEICQAIVRIAAEMNIQVLYPVHLNPNVREPVNRILGKSKNVFLIEPQDYLSFVFLMNECRLILTDSGGVQEEAPSLGKRVLVMRDVTERPEAIRSGIAKLTGANADSIVRSVKEALENNAPMTLHNPYGDGTAAMRIVNSLVNGPGAGDDWAPTNNQRKTSLDF